MITKDAEGMVYIDGQPIGRVLNLFSGKYAIVPRFHFCDCGTYASEQSAIDKLVALSDRAARVFAA